jgi:hypothetical protein
MVSLFDPIKLGAIELPNRIIMSPLTRSRSGVSRTPNDLMKLYYTQRATAGLIITEATSVSPMGVGYADTPGIWSEDQVLGWKKITESVHDAGGRIILQLWHVGRISDPIFLDGKQPVAPSAIQPKGHVSLVRPEKDYVIPRALNLNEIDEVIEQFQKGAKNAKKAGFDGVEIHGANGYLLDQFLQDSTNHRDDIYGGSLENRARLMLEVTDAVISVWGSDRVGMHISPRADAHDMGDSDLLGTFTYVAEQLGKRRIAFICARESVSENWFGPKLKAAFGGMYIANQGFTKEIATNALKTGEVDAVAFGQLFIANPDLPFKLKNNLPLNTPDYSTFYVGGKSGYIDYPYADKAKKIV